jgi:hypothetical protein
MVAPARIASRRIANTSRTSVPAEYHVNPEDELLSVKIAGPTDLVDVYELGQTILADPAFDHAWPQLVDVRGIELHMREGAMKPFADYIVGQYRSATDGAIAVVISGDLEQQQVAGIFKLVCAMSNTEMFDDYGLAIKWLLSKSWSGKAGGNGKANGNGAARPSLQPPDPRN